MKTKVTIEIEIDLAPSADQAALERSLAEAQQALDWVKEHIADLGNAHRRAVTVVYGDDFADDSPRARRRRLEG